MLVKDLDHLTALVNLGIHNFNDGYYENYIYIKAGILRRRVTKDLRIPERNEFSDNDYKVEEDAFIMAALYKGFLEVIGSYHEILDKMSKHNGD